MPRSEARRPVAGGGRLSEREARGGADRSDHPASAAPGWNSGKSAISSPRCRYKSKAYSPELVVEARFPNIEAVARQLSLDARRSAWRSDRCSASGSLTAREGLRDQARRAAADSDDQIGRGGDPMASGGGAPACQPWRSCLFCALCRPPRDVGSWVRCASASPVHEVDLRLSMGGWSGWPRRARPAAPGDPVMHSLSRRDRLTRGELAIHGELRASHERGVVRSEEQGRALLPAGRRGARPGGAVQPGRGLVFKNDFMACSFWSRGRGYAVKST